MVLYYTVDANLALIDSVHYTSAGYLRPGKMRPRWRIVSKTDHIVYSPVLSLPVYCTRSAPKHSPNSFSKSVIEGLVSYYSDALFTNMV